MARIPSEHRRRIAACQMPAEWEPHLATYLVWPHNRDTWPGKFAAIAPQFAAVAAAIAAFEPVRLLVNDPQGAAEARVMIEAAIVGGGSARESIERVETITVPTNDSWIRDYGPTFVNRTVAAPGEPPQLALDWRFNSWGEKYGPYDLDDVVPHRLGEHYNFEVIEPGIVLEGGSIEVNGAGIALTTESCLLNPNRNPTLSRVEIEDYLRTYLGVQRVLWLGTGIAGDDTDGHIDDLARFVNAETIVTVIENDPADQNHRPLAENLKRLRAMRDPEGRPFRIETLPMPPALYYDGARLPASYANFYLVNGGVVMPSFDCPSDAAAAEVLKRLFPDRRVVSVAAIDLVWGLGTIHCLTQQHPISGVPYGRTPR